MIVRPYEPGHLLALDLRDYERGFLAEVSDLRAYAEILRHGVAFTLWDGHPVGCFGILRIKPGVGEGWLCLSTALPIGKPGRAWAEAARLIERQLDREMARFHRVQVALPIRFLPGHKLVERLGFEPEAVMRKFGADGSDFTSFARIA